MKNVILLLALFSIGAHAQSSQYSTVTIYGKSASYLMRTFGERGLDHVTCVRGPRSPYLGVIECTFHANKAMQVQKQRVEIFGLAAAELYHKASRTPDSSGIECFIDTQVNQKLEVGCQLNGFIIEVSGL